MASFALSATTGSARKHAWTKMCNLLFVIAHVNLKYILKIRLQASLEVMAVQDVR